MFLKIIIVFYNFIRWTKDKIFHIFNTEQNFKTKIDIKRFGNKNYLSDQNLRTIKDAQQKALIKTFKRRKFLLENFK